jgi:hypothetical protein
VAQRRYIRFTCGFALVAVGLFAADDGKTAATAAAGSPGGEKTTTGPSRPAAVPPVLRNTEPSDSHFVLLPGLPPAAAAAPARAFAPPAPAAPKPAETAAALEPPPPELNDPGRPILRRAPRPLYPDDFEKDSGLFCQKQIGQWKEVDAMALLGPASTDRPAFDDKQNVNGRIYAFTDPTNHYKQLELDFDGDTGALRTVFVYPWRMTWQDCRRLWGANVSAAEANQGRKFYSYLNRRLDVLVDGTGKVISIGLY